MNYGELKTRIDKLSKRSDLIDDIPIFIELAESDINRDLRSRFNEGTAVLTMAGGRAELPADYRALRNLFYPGLVVSYLPVDRFYSSKAYGEGGGRSTAYTIDGNSLVIGSAPIDGTKVTLTYFKKLAKLTEEADTNEILNEYLGLYLYGALKHAMIYTENDTNAVKYSTIFDDEIIKVNKESRRSRQGMSLRRTPGDAP